MGWTTEDERIAELLSIPTSAWTDDDRAFAQSFLTKWFNDRGIDIDKWVQMRRLAYSPRRGDQANA